MVVKVDNAMRMTRLPTLMAQAELMTRKTPEGPEMLQVGRVDTAAR